MGGFGLCGIPENLIAAVRDGGAKDLTCVSDGGGVDDFGLGTLLSAGRVSKMVCSYLGNNATLERMYLGGELEVEFTPQGSLAERLRAGGAGIPAFFTPTGIGTCVEDGTSPARFGPDGSVVKRVPAREKRAFRGRQFLMEESIVGDFALVKARKADTMGNVVFHRTARNFNPDIARAARVCVVEVEELVEAGSIDPGEAPLVPFPRAALTAPLPPPGPQTRCTSAECTCSAW